MSFFGSFNQPNVVELKSQGDVEGLIEALNYEKDHNVRLAAASALGKLEDAQAVEPLIEALNDRREVKEVAILSLGKIGDPVAVEALINMLTDKNWEIRGSAAKALGQIGDLRGVIPLIDAVEDNSESVRWIAANALTSITGQTFGEDAAQWEQWWIQNQNDDEMVD
jgi:HEAT repeat protein